MLDEDIQARNTALGLSLPSEQVEGAAYPGIFLLDGDGIVREKRIFSDVRIRENIATMLGKVFG